ncbi:Transcriptional regulator, MarR family OS=Tsukamurella paurometabola (strain ATCC 8368 / DSM/ CCUG 35730 / CIP 100753 / JCM 10117 / KCTC 9821 / NBRC 16120/ NCIMB 702349 / NCTC 13040) OX=521096 GN=Tpau_0549 PE=4 SV=1 [Tsukamurella paurometabola]|uniref:Transcriptional regulator, MarR family n=1 Tax=Tsukamurella paurometabola (strain ATCC 8368 / DSM 20162 / CCUG 35730 / CIP 100753 / JCM 10117 / KCTC 9821 / NBRC 16120 / NCIMB 702349 / NCTC 13040) TaxID=521096 RepID=D5USC2_TSUPD|nr:MarR family transcriptional regulator [Tsukamurella paurometabola]ADG77189.1 transcriptional regulator, MarR family [Tsukamurella paurometabola DSM 20162]SUP43102.1 MarR family [Tsukamurella paurometabola]
MTDDERAERIEDLVRVIADLTRLKERHAAMTRHAVAPDGVELAAYSALFALVKDGPMRSSVLAEQIHTDPSTASRYVTTLTNQGYAERTPDPSDRRAALVAATQAGRDKVAFIREQRNIRLRPLLQEWSDEEIEQFVKLGSRALDQFEQALRLLRED